MITASRWFGAALFALCLAGTVAAQKPLLDVTLGLWEITTTTTMSGQMPAMNTAGMTPAQKAQMEASMKEMMRPHTDVSKTCLTKEDLESGEFMGNDDPDDAECERTITRNTRNVLEMNLKCTGDSESKGQMTVEAPSPTAFKAAMQSARSQEGQTMSLNLVMTGKWLGANCGSID